MASAGFDIAEPQVLVANAAGATWPWTHLILLRRLQGARWLALRPGGLIETVDLEAVRILAVGRRGLFPDSLDGFVETFDSVPSSGALGLFHAQANQTATLLGGLPAAPDAVRSGETWRVCHTGSESFGEAVADDVVGNAGSGVVKGAMGLALVDDLWLPVERVRDSELASWLSYMRAGPGRDQRIAGDVRDAAGRRFCLLNEYLGMLRPVDRSKEADYPHPGPSACVEVLRGVRGSGKELIPYDEEWATKSGVHPNSAVRNEHRTIFHAFALFQSWDQVDLPNTAGGEYLARRVIQIQRAVKVNPKQPNFTGLHKMVEHSLDETGGLSTKEFTKHFATEAEADARVLKQNRLYRSEVESASSQQHSRGDHTDAPGAKADNKKGKKGKKDEKND